jgi:hypothetical protein
VGIFNSGTETPGTETKSEKETSAGVELVAYKCTVDCFWNNNRYYEGKTYKLPNTPPAAYFKKTDVKAEEK